MAVQLDAENAISFVTAAVRIPTDWRSPLLVSEGLSVVWPADGAAHGTEPEAEEQLWQGEHSGRGDDQELWEIQTYRKLCAHFGTACGSGAHLLSLEQVAERLRDNHRDELKKAGMTTPLVTAQPSRRRGMLDYHQLQWLNSVYFPMPPADHENAASTIVAFRPPGLAEAPPWREYLYHLDLDDAPERYAELAAIFDVLGLLAQRRSLISVSAQRRLCKIVLPWGRARFSRHTGQPSREYLFVPVITLLNRRATSQFRRTFTLTLFLLPNSKDTAQALDAEDLAALCQQAVWNDQSPALPELLGLAGLAGPLLDGPLATFVRPYLKQTDRHLAVLFDAILRATMNTLGVMPTTRHRSQSVRTLVAISRARSVVFGSTLHVDGKDTPALWSQLTEGAPDELAEHVGKLLSVNAARHGRERLVGGEGFRIDRMRVTNIYEEDTNTIVLYNPMSRFMVNIMPRSMDRFPTVSLKLGVAWLNLLAGTISSIKEILRSYRYEIEQYRNRIELLGSAEDPGKLLKDIHRTTLTILEEIDVVYSFDLVTPTYKAAHAAILQMEGISEERHHLMRELEMTTALLRAEEADQLSQKIAASTSSTEKSARSTEKSARSTDNLTKYVLFFTLLSTILAINALIDVAFKEPLRSNRAFWTMAGVDGAFIVVFSIVLWFYFRRERSKEDLTPEA